MRSFVKMKSSGNGEITLSFFDIGYIAIVTNFVGANMSFNAFCENKILAKNFRSLQYGIIAKKCVNHELRLHSRPKIAKLFYKCL